MKVVSLGCPRGNLKRENINPLSMGFRNLKGFNKALLAKQVWRLMSNPHSLAARVFRAKYYKDGNILAAEVKSNASYIWRLLMWSRDIVERGMIWRVGNGKRTKVYEDRWVAGLHGCRLTNRGAGEQEMAVESLIRDGNRWDDAKPESMFLTHEVEAIRNTPIREHGDEDEIRWRFESKGLFSVKSAYLLEMGYYEENPNTCGGDKKSWSKLVWALSIPPKVRIFMWRAFSNLIP